MNEDKIAWDPEDCHECGCEAYEFEESDWHDGAWHCPDCGAAQ